jgi:septal ring factor EnvC (AmiA/AmiB activator)
MDGASWAVVIVGAISLVSAFLSGRAAKTAARHTSDASVMNSRTQAETEAYNRARKMDTETIERQAKEIEQIRANSENLREKLRELKEDNERLHEDNDRLRRRVTRLEQQVGEHSE